MKLENFIMEQDINITSCDDIEMEKFFAEMNVLGALVECYAKQAMIMEYKTSSTDLKEFSIFQEADEANIGDSSNDTKDASKDDAVTAKAEQVKEKWYKKILGFLKKIITNISNFLTSKSLEEIRSNVENMTAEEFQKGNKDGNFTKLIKIDKKLVRAGFVADTLGIRIGELSSDHRTPESHDPRYFTWNQISEDWINDWDNTYPGKFNPFDDDDLPPNLSRKIFINILSTNLKWVIKDTNTAKKSIIKANDIPDEVISAIKNTMAKISKEYSEGMKELRVASNKIYKEIQNSKKNDTPVQESTAILFEYYTSALYGDTSYNKSGYVREGIISDIIDTKKRGNSKLIISLEKIFDEIKVSKDDVITIKHLPYFNEACYRVEYICNAVSKWRKKLYGEDVKTVKELGKLAGKLKAMTTSDIVANKKANEIKGVMKEFRDLTEKVLKIAKSTEGWNDNLVNE